MIIMIKKSNLIILFLFMIIILCSRGIVDSVKQEVTENKKENELKRYPIEYVEIIQSNAQLNGIDPYLILAFIKTESDFKATAVSELGAIGLMQIMPDAFDWLKFRLTYVAENRSDETETVFDDLYIPEKNIQYGAYLLGFIQRYFEINVEDGYSEDEITVISASYFLGYNGVERWLSDKAYTADGKTLNNIPDNDTKHYTTKINYAYKKYNELYAEQELTKQTMQ